MSVVDSVKRAPRWAWLTAAGVGIGAAGVKLYRDRAAPAPTDVPGDTIDGGSVGVGQAASPIGGYPGVVVPPVVIGSTSQDENQGVGVLQDLYVGAIADVVNGWGGLVSQLVGQQSNLLDTTVGTISSLATAGGPPGQVIQNPSPIVVSVPVPQPAPAPLPQITPPRPLDGNAACGVFGMKWNPANGAPGGKSCYRVNTRQDCFQHNRRTITEHVYGDGHVVIQNIAHVGRC